MSRLHYTTITEDLAPQCAELERLAFPSTDPDELFSETGLVGQARVFPEGFFVVLDGDRVVGQAGGIFVDFDFDDPQHTFAEVAGEHGFEAHDPGGDWYYGTDIAVHPDYRRRGIGSELYRLRKQLVRDHGKRGIIAGGYLANYHEHKHEMSAAEYCRRVSSGELYDRTLTFQIENGFEIRGVLEGYLADERNDGWAALIVWPNEEAP